MTERTGTNVRLTINKVSPMRGTAGPGQRILGLIRRCLSFVGGIARSLFSTASNGKTGAILPGHRAEIDVTINAPGLRAVYLYAEANRAVGGVDLIPERATHVPLDADGRAKTAITVVPRNDKATGEAEVTLIAVDPDDPEVIAAQVAGITIAQEGTTQILISIITITILAGMVAQVFTPEFPVLALMIAVALICLIAWGQRTRAGVFQPWRLLPLRRRLIAALWGIAGAGIWFGMMQLNLLDDVPLGLNCGEPSQPECKPSEVLFDNATAIAASFGFAFCALLALAPAIRPAWLAGRLAIVCALVPLLIYDVALLGYPGEDESIRLLTVSTPDEIANGFDHSSFTPFWKDQSAYLAAKSFYLAYPGLGFGLIWLGVLLVAVRNRLGGWRLPALSGVAGVCCLIGLQHNFLLKYGPEDLLALLGAGSLVVFAFALRLLVGVPGQWPILRGVVFLMVMCVFAVAVPLAGDAIDDAWSLGYRLGPVVVVVAILWLLAETSLTLWWHKRRRRKATLDGSTPDLSPQPDREQSGTA